MSGRSTSGAAADAGPAILIVDDTSSKRLAIEAVLAPLGHRTICVESGEAALRQVMQRTFAVILMDVQMPEMDGLEASRQLCRLYPREVRPRIVAMTANAMAGDREACLEAGMDDYVSKPIRVEALASALARTDQLLEGRSRA